MYNKITFVCTGNTCRSPMAKAIFDDIINSTDLNIITDSCGVSATYGLKATQNAIKACNQFGITSISSHISKPINKECITNTDLFVVMTSSHAKVLLSMGVSKEDIYILNVSDPYMGDLDVYLECFDDIKMQLIALIEMIKRQGLDRL